MTFVKLARVRQKKFLRNASEPAVDCYLRLTVFSSEVKSIGKFVDLPVQLCIDSE